MKFNKNVEWSIVDDEVLLVNTETGKVLTGNASVASVIGWCVDMDVFSTEDIVNEMARNYSIDQTKYEDFVKDIGFIVDYMKKEQIIIDDI